MPATRTDRAKVKLRTMAPWRRLFPNRTVRRNVQGVELRLPWSHLLPDFARARPTYGQNLVDLAGALADREGERDFTFIDIGANVGDSCLQVLKRAGGRTLCIEGDPYWARYLRMNVGDDPRATIEEVMLGTEEDASGGFVATREGGTTAFHRSDGQDGDNAPVVPVEEVKARNPDFADARLIKSDTDGFDAVLLPAAARAWAQSHPVLFFEFDPELTRRVTGRDADRIWDELAALGYTRLAVWDNTGDPLGQLEVQSARDESAVLQPPSPDLGYTFWDVAARHANDAEAAAVFDELMDRRFSARVAA